jgi:nicotinate-nucleotide adenylyltransferase
MGETTVEKTSTEEMKDLLETRLSPPRFAHSLGAAEVCRALAEKFGLDPGRAYFMGLVHDLARELPEEAILELVSRYDLPIDELEKKKPVLLHGKIGARLLRDRYGVDDEDVLDAVEHHTLGRPGWTGYGKILYIADYREPTRRFITEEFQGYLAGLSLDEMLLAVILHEKEHRTSLAPMTQAMYDELERNRS